MKALVAEDSLPNQKILVLTLKKMGFEVEAFENGEAAWTCLSEAPEGWDIVFSDIMMPKMDGIELLKNLREHPILKPVPFFLVSAVTEKHLLLEAGKLGVNAYIVKPISYVKILAKLEPLFPGAKFPAAA